jgi:hypothetical protein
VKAASLSAGTCTSVFTIRRVGVSFALAEVGSTPVLVLIIASSELPFDYVAVVPARAYSDTALAAAFVFSRRTEVS